MTEPVDPDGGKCQLHHVQSRSETLKKVQRCGDADVDLRDGRTVRVTCSTPAKTQTQLHIYPTSKTKHPFITSPIYTPCHLGANIFTCHSSVHGNRDHTNLHNVPQHTHVFTLSLIATKLFVIEVPSVDLSCWHKVVLNTISPININQVYLSVLPGV